MPLQAGTVDVPLLCYLQALPSGPFTFPCQEPPAAAVGYPHAAAGPAALLPAALEAAAQPPFGALAPVAAACLPLLASALLQPAGSHLRHM